MRVGWWWGAGQWHGLLQTNPLIPADGKGQNYGKKYYKEFNLTWTAILGGGKVRATPIWQNCLSQNSYCTISTSNESLCEQNPSYAIWPTQAFHRSSVVGKWDLTQIRSIQDPLLNCLKSTLLARETFYLALCLSFVLSVFWLWWGWLPNFLCSVYQRYHKFRPPPMFPDTKNWKRWIMFQDKQSFW